MDFKGEEADLPQEFKDLYSFLYEYRQTAQMIEKDTYKRASANENEQQTFVTILGACTVFLLLLFIYTFIKEMHNYRNDKLSNSSKTNSAA